MSEFERGEQLNAIVRSWNPEAERLKHQIERAREAARQIPVSLGDTVALRAHERLDAILSEDASDATETQDSGEPKLYHSERQLWDRGDRDVRIVLARLSRFREDNLCLRRDLARCMRDETQDSEGA